MNGGQTPTSGSKRAKKLTLAAALLVVGAGGLASLLGPFVAAGEPWEWKPQSEGELFGAAVNANLVSAETNGVLLTPQGARAISLISPPLALPADANRVLVVRAAMPDVAAGGTVEATVRLLWQTQPAEGYHFASQTVQLGLEPVSIEFSLPAAPTEVYRLGVQFPGVTDAVLIESFGLPRQSLAERLAVAWREASGSEPIANYSVNFLRGPRILGHGFNYYLVLAVLTACAGYAAVRVAQGRGVSRQGLAVIVFVVWLVADGQATRNLARQAWAEAAALRGKTWQEQVELMNGPEIAWAYQRLLEETPPGSAFAVVSDDDFAPSRRLAYLLAPERVWRESWEWAEFIVVVGAREAAFDELSGVFQWKSGPPVRVERIAAMSAEVYLLRVRSAARLSPTGNAAIRSSRLRGDEQSRAREEAVTSRIRRPAQSRRDRSLTVAALFGRGGVRGSGRDSEGRIR